MIHHPLRSAMLALFLVSVAALGMYVAAMHLLDPLFQALP